MKSKFTSLFLLLAAPLLHAQATPSLMSYQGRVTDAAGVLIGNTTPTNRSVIFKLYSTSSGGTALYAETQTVTISGGEFSVLVGNGTGISGSPGPSSPASTPYKTIADIVNSGTYTSLYLGVTVDDGTAAADLEISPRQQMVSGAFAVRAKVAESVVGGAVTTAMMGDGQVSTSKIASGAVDSSRILDSSIVATDIANSTITAAKLDTGTIGLWTPVGAGVYRNGYVGIGEANPGFPLNFGTGLGFGDKISLWNNAGNSYGFGMQGALLQIHTDSAGSDVAFGYGSSAAMTETMRVKGNGNVGIGYTSPGAKLDVNGVGRFGSDSAKIGWVDVGFYADAGNVGLRAPTNGVTIFQSASGANTWMQIANGGNVGIGNTNADVKLSVSGGVRAAGAGTSAYPYSGGYSFASPGDTDGGMFSPSDGIITWLANGGEKMRLTYEGRLGIGTASPSVPLDVVGAVSYTMVDNRFSGNNGVWNGNTWTNSDTTGNGGVELYSMDGIGNISTDKNVVAKVGIRADGWIVTAKGFAAYSDRRIKRDAQVSPSAKDLAAIEKLKVTNYRMVDPEGGDISWHKGFIAQEVAEVIPGAVTQSVNFVPDIFTAAIAAVYDAGKQTLRVSLAKEHGLVAGERVRLHTDGNRQDLTVSAVLSANEFVVDHCEKAPEKVFVYGREVSDFNTLDYNRIYTTSVGAIQELAHKIEAGESENAALKTRQADLEARLGALEKLVAPSR